jgi:hypothetical protein
LENVQTIVLNIDLHLKACLIYNNKMDPLNTDILYTTNTQQSLTTGKCIRYYTINTTKHYYKPADPSYFNTYLHENKMKLPCDICGKIVVKKIKEHNMTNNCRLTYFLQQEKLRANDKL